MTRVKICGITRAEDGLAAAEAGADAVGLNFVGGPRRIDVATAERILDALPPLCTSVVLVDVGTGAMPAEVQAFLARRRVTHVQLYGAVNGELLTRLVGEGCKPILVQRVRNERMMDDVDAALAALKAARPAALLLDAYREGMAGGTGQLLDWAALGAARTSGRTSSWPPLILAGGLRPDNVADAIRKVRPWAVDVSSGVELSPGVKDTELMQQFVASARAAEG